jgi:hypothetical protein
MNDNVSIERPVCPTWCDIDHDVPDWIDPDGTHVSTLDEGIELILPPGSSLARLVFAHLAASTDLPSLGPDLRLSLTQDGSGPPEIDLERNEELTATFTLDEAEAFGLWILRLVEAGRQTAR